MNTGVWMLLSSLQIFLCRADGGWLVVVAAMLLSSLQIFCVGPMAGGRLLSPQSQVGGVLDNYVPINNLCAVTILPVQMVMARRWIPHKHIFGQHFSFKLIKIFYWEDNSYKTRFGQYFFFRLIKILYCGPDLQFSFVHLAAMLISYQLGII